MERIKHDLKFIPIYKDWRIPDDVTSNILFQFIDFWDIIREVIRVCKLFYNDFSLSNRDNFIDNNYRVLHIELLYNSDMQNLKIIELLNFYQLYKKITFKNLHTLIIHHAFYQEFSEENLLILPNLKVLEIPGVCSLECFMPTPKLQILISTNLPFNLKTRDYYFVDSLIELHDCPLNFLNYTIISKYTKLKTLSCVINQENIPIICSKSLKFLYINHFDYLDNNEYYTDHTIIDLIFEACPNLEKFILNDNTINYISPKFFIAESPLYRKILYKDDCPYTEIGCFCINYKKICGRKTCNIEGERRLVTF
jgi:hypothetical protein